MDFIQRISKKATGLTNKALAELVSQSGYEITTEGVRQWRTGATTPRNIKAVIALEQALDINDDSLRHALGWRTPSGVEERLIELERQVADLNRRVGGTRTVDEVTDRWESSRSDKGVDDDIDATGDLRA